MQNKIKRLEITAVDIDQLIPSEYNPRILTDKQEQDLTKSIVKFGLVDPIIANIYRGRENIIIGGHQRLAVAKKLGFKTVPVIYIKVNPEKERELNLRLNRNTGEWDWNKLQSFEMDLLLEVGFDDADMSAIWNDALETEDDNFDTEKEIELAKTTEIKPDDMLELGNHRLLCGNSTNDKTVKRLLGTNKVNMIYSDPIYNIGLDYDKGMGRKAKYGGHVNDNKSDAEYKKFLVNTLRNGLSVSSPDVHVFYYCDQNYIGLLQSLYKELGIINLRVCLWIKNGFNATPTIAFNKSFEPCIYGTRGKPYLSPIYNLTEILNKEISSGNRAIDDILDLLDIWLVRRLAGNEYEHPTAKPPVLHERALRRCTKINDIVLDLFGGAGSTMIACEQLKRRCFMVEIEPVFCQVIVNRWEKLTGLKAKLIN